MSPIFVHFFEERAEETIRAHTKRDHRCQAPLFDRQSKPLAHTHRDGFVHELGHALDTDESIDLTETNHVRPYLLFHRPQARV
jgi:hypothetical protein